MKLGQVLELAVAPPVLTPMVLVVLPTISASTRHKPRARCSVVFGVVLAQFVVPLVLHSPLVLAARPLPVVPLQLLLVVPLLGLELELVVVVKLALFSLQLVLAVIALVSAPLLPQQLATLAPPQSTWVTTRLALVVPMVLAVFRTRLVPAVLRAPVLTQFLARVFWVNSLRQVRATTERFAKSLLLYLYQLLHPS